MQKRDKKYRVEKSCEKYESYDKNVWSLEFFDRKTGGYVVVNRNRRRNAIKYKNEGTKYGKELAMVKVFAQNGHAMTPVVSAELRKLSEMGIHGKYFISGKDKVLDF